MCFGNLAATRLAPRAATSCTSNISGATVFLRHGPYVELCYTFSDFAPIHERLRRQNLLTHNTIAAFILRRLSHHVVDTAAIETLVRMPLSPPVPRRILKHTRILRVEAFAREDDLWDIEAQITDVKTRTVTLASGVRPAGDALHDLKLRLTIDREFNVIAAESASDSVPYPGFCEVSGSAYRRLVGLNLIHGFRQQLMARVGGVAGCTHLTELAHILPTAAIQAFAGDVLATRDGDIDDTDRQPPFQLDRCHALRTGGAAVARFYPRWAQRPIAPI